MEAQTEDGHERNWQKGAFFSFFLSQQSSRGRQDLDSRTGQISHFTAADSSAAPPPGRHYPTTIGPPNHLHPSFPEQTDSVKSHNAASPNPLEQKIRREKQRPRPVFSPHALALRDNNTISYRPPWWETDGGREQGRADRETGGKEAQRDSPHPAYMKIKPLLQQKLIVLGAMEDGGRR